MLPFQPPRAGLAASLFLFPYHFVLPPRRHPARVVPSREVDPAVTIDPFHLFRRGAVATFVLSVFVSVPRVLGAGGRAAAIRPRRTSSGGGRSASFGPRVHVGIDAVIGICPDGRV